MCVVREPSVPERDRDGKPILSYPILIKFGLIQRMRMAIHWSIKSTLAKIQT
jgi:hypothetical protein